jgi:hypothetical protein
MVCQTASRVFLFNKKILDPQIEFARTGNMEASYWGIMRQAKNHRGPIPDSALSQQGFKIQNWILKYNITATR